MKFLIQLKHMIHHFKQAMAAFCAGIMTLLLCLAVPLAQASDIEIYKKATAGTVTLMFLLDNSGSMTSNSDSTGLTRLERVRNGMITVLAGGDGISKIDDDKVIGLSTFYNSSAGYVMVPARALSTAITGGGTYTQKKPMVQKYYPSSTSSTPVYSSCTAWSSYATCTSWGTASTTSPSLSGYSNTACAYVNSKTCTLYYTNTSVSVTDQRTLLLSYISTWTGSGSTPTANAYAEVGAYMFGTTTATTTTASIPMYFTYSSSSSTTIWYSCGSSGSTSTSNCTTTLSSTPSTNGYQTTVSGNDTYYYKKSRGTTTYYYRESVSSSSSTTYYQSCTAYTSSGCTSWGSATTTNPTTSSYNTSCTVNSITGSCVYETKTVTSSPTGSGFSYSTADAKNSDGTAYTSPVNTSSTECSGQGIYILTDGEPNGSSVTIAKNLMQNALTSTYSGNLTCSGTLFTASSSSSTGWQCISDFSQLLRNRTIAGSTSSAQLNPLGVDIKTAVVGFGSDFNGITSYSSSLTQAQNLANISSSSASDDVKNAARLGVYGGGGWYSGSSSSDVVTSVNNFITSLTTDIPAVTTGASYIPTDELNPTVVQNYAYSAQFQPTPAEVYQLWLGNLKKYNVISGLIEDIKGNSIVDSSGTYVTNYDIWSQYVTDSTLASTGGVEGVLPVGMTSSYVANRKLLTNRDTSGAVTTTTLNQIGSSYVTNTTDADRGYLLSLLGYVISTPSDTTSLPTTTAGLAALSTLRQIGAVMHSTPVLLTQSGTVTTTSGVTSSSNRDDYVLFGTTQGVLSVVDADTGAEQFAFVPNELITTQKRAFQTNTATTGFSSSTYQPLYYGVDGPWTAYSQYVSNSDGSLTVGSSDISGATGEGMQMAYGGLRMGGRSYYALNLQDMSNPQMAFHIDPNNTAVYCNSSSQTDTPETCASSKTYKELGFMGQSWSKPSVGWVKWKGSKRLVMFVGGGYDAGGTNGDGTFSGSTGERTAFAGYEDEYAQTNKIGAGVYMFDALTGQLLWWAGANATSSNTTSGVQYTTSANMKYSVVSQIKTVDRDSDGLIDHLYFGDLGGQVWRIDLNNTLTSTTDTSMFAKTPVRLLNLNNGQYSPRFYDMPAFSTYSYSGSKFGVISIGSGNHSSPLFDTSDTTYKNDAIYNIYDKDVARSDLFTVSGSSYSYDYSSGNLNTQDLTLSSLGKLTTNANTTAVAPYSTTGGWYYYFASSMTQDEKILTTPTVLDYDLYVTSYDGSQEGSSGDCGSGVKGESYVTQFCMPYGVCTESQIASSTFISHTAIGVGIVAPSVGSSNSTGTNRALITSTGTLASSSSTAAATYSTSLALTPKRWFETSK
ncbi:pilus assembly protein PilY [Acinetobacter sp. MB5]|uniref:pilus assembly protein PilY n=1 Tax=Acinetobacter sp. MB5 TaxID=2069438 RepID=UPI000DCF7394|nr:pilus assembly protein PilY [Acinetobacter sp. MB5]